MCHETLVIFGFFSEVFKIHKPFLVCGLYKTRWHTRFGSGTTVCPPNLWKGDENDITCPVICTFTKKSFPTLFIGSISSVSFFFLASFTRIWYQWMVQNCPNHQNSLLILKSKRLKFFEETWEWFQVDCDQDWAASLLELVWT